MDLNNALSLLAQTLLVIAIPIVIAFLFQWARQKNTELRSRLTAQQQQFIETAVNFAVRAAEQSGLKQQVAGGGQGKKAFALKAAQDYLGQLGVKVDVSLLSSLVEAEVHKQFSNSAPLVDSAEARSALLDKAVQAAVLAAEQSGVSGVIQNIGAQKKRYALEMASRYLAEHGIKADPALVNGLVEAQIAKLHMPKS